MKFKLLYIFLCFWSVSFSQIKNGPRIPDIKDGNILLYKSDTLIVSYYWFSGKEEGFWDGCSVKLKDEYYFYQYELHLIVKNVLKNDTIYYKYKLKTYEAKPTQCSTSVETKTGYKYGFESLSPNNSLTYEFYSSNGDIVDFMFEEFVIKFKSGKTLFITKELNKNKQLTYRKLIPVEE